MCGTPASSAGYDDSNRTDFALASRQLSRGRPKDMSKPSKSAKDGAPSFQDLILRLERFSADQGCVILQPYDMEMGAATFHPATALRPLGPKPWRAAYVQPCPRPKAGRP